MMDFLIKMWTVKEIGGLVILGILCAIFIITLIISGIITLKDKIKEKRNNKRGDRQ